MFVFWTGLWKYVLFLELIRLCVNREFNGFNVTVSIKKEK